MVNHLSELLERFKNLGVAEQLSKEALVEEINNSAGSNFVTTRDIKIKNHIALVKGGTALKSEIILHKTEILNKVREKMKGKFFLSDIR